MTTKGNGQTATGTLRLKTGLAEMLRGGVIMDVVTAEQLDQLVVNDLDHLLSGRDALQHLLPYSTILYPSNERFSDLVIDVSLEKYATNLAHRLLDVGLRQLTLASKLLENAFELFGQLIEHGNPSRIRHSTDR